MLYHWATGTNHTVWTRYHLRDDTQATPRPLLTPLSLIPCESWFRVVPRHSTAWFKVFLFVTYSIIHNIIHSEILGDVYTEVLEAAHPLHRGPTDHKRSVGPLLSLPEVHNQFFSFAHVQRETVVLAPWFKTLYLIQVCGLIIVGNEAQNHSIISKFNKEVELWEDTQSCVERVEQGTQDTTLWCSYVQGDGVGGELAHFHHLRSAGEEILNPVTEWRV